MKRITCSDLGIGGACDHVIEAEDDDELLERLARHTRDEHELEDFDPETARPLIKSAP